jgi:hypothetical protein
MSTKSMPTTPLGTPAASAISSPNGPAVPAVPSLDDLYRMTARSDRVVVRGVGWAYYERLLEVVGVRSSIRLASDFLPIRADEVARWVLEEDTSDPSDWEQRLRTWVQTKLVGRRGKS